MSSSTIDTTIQYFTIDKFHFQDGTALPQVQLAYREFNPTETKIALIPTCFRGRINSTLNFANGASYVDRLSMWSLARDNGGCANQTWASPTCSGLTQSSFQFTSTFKTY